MKYIIFKDEKTGLTQPVMFGEHTTHSQVKIEGAKPVSAGFCHVSSGDDLTITGASESLKLKPGENDAAYIAMMLCDAGTSFFLEFDKLDALGK